MTQRRIAPAMKALLLAAMSLHLQVAAVPDDPARAADPASPRPVGPDSVRADRLPAGGGLSTEAISRAVWREIDAGLFPGVVLLVGRPGRVLYHETFGHARIVPEKVPMQKDCIFDLASVTKVVATATAFFSMLLPSGFRCVPRTGGPHSS